MLTHQAAGLSAGALPTTLSADSHPEEPKSGSLLTHRPATAAFSAPPLPVPLSALPPSLSPRVALLRAPHGAAAVSPGRSGAAPRAPPAALPGFLLRVLRGCPSPATPGPAVTGTPPPRGPPHPWHLPPRYLSRTTSPQLSTTVSPDTVAIVAWTVDTTLQKRRRGGGGGSDTDPGHPPPATTTLPAPLSTCR